MSDHPDAMVGIQVGPAPFVDEGVDTVLDTLQDRVGINAILLGTVSWLGLKIGRSISWEVDGWPDHGVAEPADVHGGSYLNPRPELYRTTFLSDFRAPDEGMKGKDILDMVVPAARERGMKVIPELMEPLFKYEGHGSATKVSIPNLPQVLEVDHLGRISSEPCLEHPAYRGWWHALIEDHCRNYDIDGIMWCNERRSPLDRLVSGLSPTCFCVHCIRAMRSSDIDPEGARRACRHLYDFFGDAAAGGRAATGAGSVGGAAPGEPSADRTPASAWSGDGALVEFLRVLLENPEILLLERHWVRRNKDLDRELYGITKWCDPQLEFGLNVWNRNHFNPVRKAQWPWAEVKDYADWVKPITYQHQAGQIYVNEMSPFHRTILRDFTPQEFTPVMYRILGLDEAPWDDVVATGLGPASYVGGQCRDTIAALDGELPVYMGIGVDAPRVSESQARCTPEIVYESVKATFDAGGAGVIFSPNYASMKLSNLDGAARALKEVGVR